MELDFRRPSGGVVVRSVSSKEEQAALEQLLNRCFPVLPGTSFFDDFPIWDETHGAEIHHVGVFSESGHIVSSACIRMGWLKSPSARTEEWVALLGAVATHPKWRGKGLASQAIQEACKMANQFGASAVFLFGSEYELYRKQGFEWVGEQARVSLNAIKWGDVKSSPYEEGWNPALLNLLAQRPLGLRLSDRDESWIAAHKNMRWLWRGPKNQPTSYIAIGKGIDLHGMIHEWGGDAESLRELIATTAMREPELELLCPPEFAQILGTQVATESLCMVKVLKAGYEIPSDLWLWGLDGV